jgi:hypothetical protein
MHHVGTITKATKHPTKGFHAQCSCGPAGDFATVSDAAEYLRGHFGKLDGISTSELRDLSNDPNAQPIVTAQLPLSPHSPVGATATVAKPKEAK